MKKAVYYLLTVGVLLNIEIFSQCKQVNEYKETVGLPGSTYLNLNNISTVIQNNGISDYNHPNSGFEFPKGTGKTAVYISGLVWGAYLNRPGENDPHLGGSVYRSGLQGGKILSPGVAEDPSLPHVRIYRVRSDVFPGGPSVDLSWEAFEEGKTQAEVRAQYETDWVEWRAQDGAPFDDVDGNGSYDPEIDIPGVAGAGQTVWFVANDLDMNTALYLNGTLPMGIELQATFWEYKNGSYLDNVLFRNYKLINKSEVTFDSMYISMWSDPDIGYAADDVAGCDTTLNLGYALNGYEYDAEYNELPPPAVGFQLLKGPSVSGGSALQMTAFYHFVCGGDPLFGCPPQGNYQGAVEFYRFMQGKSGLTDQIFLNPITRLPTTYTVSGDPLTGEGWIDGIDNRPGDRDIGLASGPFNMAVGDTQDVVIAEIAALGIDRLGSFKKLKFYSSLVQNSFNTGYDTSTVPNPPVPTTTVDKSDHYIKLNWGTDSQSVNSIENYNKDGYQFQGYNVYQLKSDVPILGDAFRIVTYDVIDGVTEIPGTIMDSATGLPVQGVLFPGSDSGIRRNIVIDHDYFENSSLIPHKKYYYAVTAYTFNPQAPVKNSSESTLGIVEATYFDHLPGPRLGDKISAVHHYGNGFGNITVTVTNPANLTGDDYEVYFDSLTYYRNQSGEWNPLHKGMNKVIGNYTDTLAGSTIDIGAIYGEEGGTVELICHLNLVSPDNAGADGISMTFPSNVAVLDVPEVFYANYRYVLPEIAGNTVNIGIVDGSQTGNGLFTGGETWRIIISSFTPPLTVDWIIYDDGYSGSSVNAEGSTAIEEIGYEFKLKKEWNVRNLTNLDTLLEHQTVINGYDIYTGKKVEEPEIEGFKISIDAEYNAPRTYYSMELFPGPGSHTYLDNFSGNNEGLSIQDWTWFAAYSGNAKLVYAIGTDELSELVQDYELRFTGVWDSTEVSSQKVYYVASGGQMATVFRMEYNGELGDHPLNPHPGVDQPFLIRIPFEVWNVNDPENPYQVNLTFQQRQSEGFENPFYTWDLNKRMYAIIVNSPYDENQIIQVDGGPDQYNADATWTLVFFSTDYSLNDVVKITYADPIQMGVDRFTFSTPEAADTSYIIPTTYQLFQNFPNPFNPGTTIRYYIPEKSFVKLEVYDILGQRVTRLINTELEAGFHNTYFDGYRFASGIYIYLLNINDKFFQAKKMVLIK